MADGKQTTGTEGGGTRSRRSSRATATRGRKGNGQARPPKTGRGAAETRPKAAPRAKQPDLRRDLRDFASARPEGWNHEDWLGFLESLEGRGHDIRDREAIGLALERERLDLALSRVRGVGPQRRSALVERYGTTWNLRNADAHEIAEVANMPRSLAEKVSEEFR